MQRCHLWSKRFGDATGQAPTAIAADSTGNVVIAGLFHGSLDFGAGPLVAMGTGGESDVFVAKFGPDGALSWNKQFGGIESDQLSGLAVDASGAVVIAGNSYDAIDLGGGPLDSGLGNDVWVGKLDAAGVHVWSVAFAQSYFSPVVATADSAGAIFLAGTPFSDSLMIHGGSSIAGDLLLAKLGADGGLLWAKGFGQGGQSTIESIAAIAADSS